MAGGSGERFWPLSRHRYPKQLLKITGARSMLGAAVERIQPIVSPEDIYIVTSRLLKPAIEAEVRELPPENVIAEPAGKNTAACLALSAAFLEHRYQLEDDVVMVVMTADHYIRDTGRFLEDCQQAIAFAEKHFALVTFGIAPDRPETGYGYIECGAPASDCAQNERISRIASFREKPDPAAAQQFCETGRFLWNSGMFVWRNSVLREAFRQHLPAAAAQIPAMREAFAVPDPDSALASAFDHLVKISIDNGVLEKADNVFVVRASFDWDDIGTWGSLSRLFERDSAGNVSHGKSLLINCSNSIVYSSASGDGSEPPPVVVGYNLKDIVIVRTGDAILVLPAESAQQVRNVVSCLREQGLTEYL